MKIQYSISELRKKIGVDRIYKWFKKLDWSIQFFTMAILGHAIFLLLWFSADWPENWKTDIFENARIEFIGFGFDLVLLGLILSIITKRNQKQQDINRWKELIDDFREWDQKEATYRIVGAIKRLNKAEVFNINLSSCYLKGAKLYKVNLRNSFLSQTNFTKADLRKAQFQKSHSPLGTIFFEANLFGANFTEASLENSNFQKADLRGADFTKAILVNVDFNDAHLSKTVVYMRRDKLQNKSFFEPITHYSNLSGAILDNAKVSADWLEKLDEWEVIGREKIQNIYERNESGVLVRKDGTSIVFRINK